MLCSGVGNLSDGITDDGGTTCTGTPSWVDNSVKDDVELVLSSVEDGMLKCTDFGALLPLDRCFLQDLRKTDFRSPLFGEHEGCEAA